MTVVVRGRINDRNEWTDQSLIFRAPAERYTTSGSHYGCRLIFDPQGHLFFTLGERGNQANAQDLTTPLGKIHRVNDGQSFYLRHCERFLASLWLAIALRLWRT